MADLIYTFLTGVGGMILIAVAWFGVQSLVRRNSPHLSVDCDLLESMCHDCGSCAEAGNCGLHRQ
ncbi:MAG: hypothetical protein AMXMBFR82_44070 [Candidatus Hydrogenedentota bacterium]